MKDQKQPGVADWRRYCKAVRSSIGVALAASALFFLNAALAGATPGFVGTRWGINESGLEFGKGLLAGTNYVVPDAAYYLQHNVELVRIPFQIGRLQSAPGAPLTPKFLGYLTKIVQQNAAAGAVTVLDPHSFGTYPINGEDQNILLNETAGNAYVDLMGKIAASFVNFGKDAVAIGLINEPHSGSDQAYAPLWNRAIAAIRTAGFHGVILVPHTHWSAARDINPVTPFLGTIVDPDHNWVLELHSYLDPDDSGIYRKPIASVTVGADRLAGAIAWSRQNHVRLFLGETGTPADAPSIAALRTMLNKIAAAPDVFWGVAFWGGGPWWKPSYPMRLDPVSGVDTPQFLALEGMIRR